MGYARTGPYRYKHITATTTAVLSTAPTDLHGVWVGNAGTTWAVTLYDDIVVTDATHVIGIFTAALGNTILDLHCDRGLAYAATGTAGDMTITFS